jgi:hypothetical protein
MVGEEHMIRTMLAATAALTLMTGIAVAQTSETTTTTTESTSAVPVVPVAPIPMMPSVTENSKQRTVDAFGNVTEHSRSVSQGAAVSPFGDTTVTRRTTETTSSVH